jgi:hypothetical protein
MSRDGGLLEVEGEGPVADGAGSAGFVVVRSDVTRGASAPNRFLAPRHRRRSVDYFIRLQNAPTSFGAAAVSPISL